MEKNSSTKNSKKSEKNWLTCLLLCIFIGGLGAHRFYVGKITSAIVKIVLNLIPTICWIIYFICLLLFATSTHGYIDETGQPKFDNNILVFFTWQTITTIVLTSLFYLANLIWALVDLIKICCQNFTDSKGKLLIQ